MSTKVHTLGTRYYTLDELPRVGAPLNPCAAYPLMHDDHGNEYFTVIYSVHVDNGILQVIGDGDNGWYEWVWFTAPVAGRGEVRHTRAGFGSVGSALYDGLKHAYAEAQPAEAASSNYTRTTFLAAWIRDDLTKSGLQLATSPKSKIEATIAKTIEDVEKTRWPEHLRDDLARKTLYQN